jgi:hypothetical protein
MQSDGRHPRASRIRNAHDLFCHVFFCRLTFRGLPSGRLVPDRHDALYMEGYIGEGINIFFSSRA